MPAVPEKDAGHPGMNSKPGRMEQGGIPKKDPAETPQGDMSYDLPAGKPGKSAPHAGKRYTERT